MMGESVRSAPPEDRAGVPTARRGPARGGGSPAGRRHYRPRTRSAAMDKGLLVREQMEGGQKLVEQLAKNGFPLKAAFWRKEDDDSRWHLYLVTPLVEERGPFEAYRQIEAAIQG